MVNYRLLPLNVRELEPPFHIDYKLLGAKVSEHEIKGKRVFRVDLNDSSKPLMVTVANGADGRKFWTSIPEGRQREAEEIGKLIAKHIRAKRD